MPVGINVSAISCQTRFPRNLFSLKNKWRRILAYLLAIDTGKWLEVNADTQPLQGCRGG